MNHHSTDQEMIRTERNAARYFTENRQIAWVVLVATVIWGVYGYIRMPKRKDPEFPVVISAAVCAWPGVASDRIEQLVTRKLEAKIAENTRVKKVESLTRDSISVVTVTLEDTVKEPAKEWDDIALRLDTIKDLPPGAGPILYLKDFGDTAALMLTVSSPKADAAEVAWRARDIRNAITKARAGLRPGGERTTGVVCFPLNANQDVPRRHLQMLIRLARERGVGHDVLPLQGPGFVGIDGDFGPAGEQLAKLGAEFFRDRLRPSEINPDSWPMAMIGKVDDLESRLAAVAGDKYSLRDLDQFTELIQRTLQAVPLVSAVQRAGVQKERIFLDYSQERLAAYGIQPSALQQILQARNIQFPGGLLEVGGSKGVLIDPSGEFKNEKEIGDVIVNMTPSGAPVYLRDGVDIVRAYETPPLYLNYENSRDEKGAWSRSRAITLAVQMRKGQQIEEFGNAVTASLNDLKQRLPPDLILTPVSDQPLQVKENISLFMQSLYEAIVLVVVVALIGFWEWRSALLMALAIPLTLAMTFGFMSVLGIDIQQVSIASLIIALGLLVDDPVVAGDAIKRELDAGQTPLISAWIGPTKLATAILYATITNIVAYLPMLLIEGNLGSFVYSLPMVLACSLVASRLASMTFVPLLALYILRPSKHPEPSMAERRKSGFAKFYYQLGGLLLEHRKKALLASFSILGLGVYFGLNLRQEFFPKDLSYLSFADVWLPEDASIHATSEAARQAEETIREVAAEFDKERAAHGDKGEPTLSSLTTFVGGGGPRFWFSVAPEVLQTNYAQIIIRLHDKHETQAFLRPLQQALSARVAGARIDVRQLETSQPIGVPVAVRVSGDDIQELRRLGEQLKAIFRAIPEADRVRDNWGAETLSVKLKVNPDRANLSGLTNLDVALSSAGGMSGLPVTTLHEGKEQIPVVTRLRTEQRARLTDIENLYIYSLTSTQKVPLEQISSVDYRLQDMKIQRYNQFRTITVGCFPVPGMLPSEIMSKAQPELEKFAASLPPGYRMAIAGEEEERVKGFAQVTVVLLVSTVLIFLALVFQFKNAVKPLIVFAAIPYGMVGALAALVIMKLPFGFMAFLGVASLIGIIVSHVIVLFDFIEEAHAHGEPFREALLDAGILRLRPVLITVGATVFALFPLALHGGPLWEPLCYAQIGGLTLATFVTLLLVPVLYAIFVLDLKIVSWEETSPAGDAPAGSHE
jgi:multidrug efflux pump subunit AcrB